MSKIIAFGNMKGGVGKTTCTILAANALSKEPFNYRITVIDVDQQKSISKLRLLDSEDFEGVFPYEVLNYNVPTFEKRIQQLDETSDFIFVDVAGKLDINLPPEHQEISRILNYVDILFIPFVAGNFSLEASLEYLRFVLGYQARREKEGRPMQVYGFTNMHRERTRSGRFLLSEIDQVQQLVKLTFMDNFLKDLTAFRDTDTLTSLYGPDTVDLARQNFSSWIDELHKLIRS